MLKQVGSICASLIVATMVSSAPAQARGGAHFNGGHYADGAHFGGIRTVGVGGRYAGYRGHYYAGHSSGRYGYYRSHWRPYYGRYWGPYRGGSYYGDYWGSYAGAEAYASEPYYEDNSAISYCMRRFRTYDPNSGTYVGNDGYRHPCP